MHNGFLKMGGDDKMSKSLGNVIGVDDLLAQGWHGEVLRLALLSAHYRQPLEWTDDLLRQTDARLAGWHRQIGDGVADAAPHASVIEALSDDLNTPKAIAALSQLANAGDEAGLAASLAFLGLGDGARYREVTEADPAVDALVAARNAARAAKNFAESDRIRNALTADGIILEDGPGGTTWRRA
jgi:cysteinyl-tRNA synthetase